MAKMLMGQIDHARGRLRNLANTKLGDSPKAPKKLSWDDVAERILNDSAFTFSSTVIKAALVKFRASRKGNRYSYGRKSFTDAIAEVIHEKENRQAQDSYLAAKKIWDAKQEAVEFERARVEDVIVLGDHAAVLAALQSFAAFEV